jgi:hypothetical protein
MPPRLRRLVATGTIPACLLLAAGPVCAQSAPTAVVARPGAAAVLDTAPCVRAVAVSGGSIETPAGADGRMYAIYRAPDTQSGDVDVTIVTGPKASADGKTCEPATAKQFRITADRTPQVSDRAMSEAFRILMTAFVLALLLESGFALLFNWRLFLEFFDGKAWRSPIMLLGALMIVRTFDLDLMASLFDAYSSRPADAPSTGGWFTSVLTAMILAGGSVGVNRILVGLGIRSQTRPETLEAQPEPHEAWIAIRVRGVGARRVQVNVDEVTPPPGEEPPTTVGMVRPRNIAQRLRELLFPSGSRVPPRGGRRVDPAKSYRITVVDPAAGRIYDALGNSVPTIASAPLFRFGARAIVDFEVTLT